MDRVSFSSATSDTCRATVKRQEYYLAWFVFFMALNATFRNISTISWRSVLLVEETGVSAENHRPVASH